MKKLLFFALAISIHFAASAADSFSTLEERMSGKEFKETGLVKLTEEELSALNDWIRRHSVATLENAAARPPASTAMAESTGDMQGFENRPKDDGSGDDINGTIVGTFDGWREIGTRFKLTNGMVWQQVEAEVFYINPTENAEVVISRGLLGGWRLSMVGSNSSVRVKRIK
jgi:hypothetical protein